MSDLVMARSLADALQEGHGIDRHVTAKALHDLANEVERLRARVAELEAERDALLEQAIADRADAERYRWLREVPAYKGPAHVVVRVAPPLTEIVGETLDAAIDAARAGNHPTGAILHLRLY